MTSARLLILGWLAILSANASFAAPAATAPPVTAPATSETPRFPQQRTIDGHVLTLYAPQIRSWPKFEQFTSSMAFELLAKGETTPKYGTATVAGQTTVDMDKRIVTIRSPKITDVTFADAVPDKYKSTVMSAVTRDRLDVPVDLFLAHVADEAMSGPAPAGFNTSPPPILVRSKPTALLFVNGTPVVAPVPNTSLQVLGNANWPLYRTSGERPTYYLLARDRWLTSGELERGWKAATSLPDDFNRLPATDEYAAVRQAIPMPKASGA